jgi:hypothetical protein
MLTTLFFTMSLAWQSGASINAQPLDLIERMYEEQARQNARERAAQRQFDATKTHVFELRFNNMAKALADFGETWNQYHRIDQHKAQRLRKAWRDLERADPWFDTSSDSK